MKAVTRSWLHPLVTSYRRETLPRANQSRSAGALLSWLTLPTGTLKDFVWPIRTQTQDSLSGR